MMQSKDERKSFKLTRKSAIVISVVLILVIATGVVVFAALRDTAGTVTETLETAAVTCEVNDDYSVTNTSNIPALIRVRVVVNQTNDSGEITPGDTPAYTVGSDWTQNGDYLYYNGILTAKDGDKVRSTASITIMPDEDTQVTVLAEAIQAAGDAAREAWGISYSDGAWS